MPFSPQQPCCRQCRYSEVPLENGGVAFGCRNVACSCHITLCHKGGEKAKCHCGKELKITVKQQIEANAVGGECFECATSHGACSYPQFFTESYADSVKRKESTPFNNLQEAEKSSAPFDKVSKEQYAAVHYWLKKKYGKSDKCEAPDCTGKSKNYTWAKLHDKEYDFERANFIKLCSSCHGKYDHTEKSKVLSRKNSINARKEYCKRGHRLDSKRTTIIKFPSGNTHRDCRECKHIRQVEYRKTHGREKEYERYNRLTKLSN